MNGKQVDISGTCTGGACRQLIDFQSGALFWVGPKMIRLPAADRNGRQPSGSTTDGRSRVVKNIENVQVRDERHPRDVTGHQVSIAARGH